MKRTANKLMIAAAVLAVATGVASAQKMTADVPFSFRVGNNVYPAGAYRIGIENGYRIVHLFNWDTRQHALALVSATGVASPLWRANGDAVAAFECGAGHCQLVGVWTGADTAAVELSRPRANRGEAVTLRLIRLAPSNGD